MPINRVVLIGNLTRDPEVRALPSGKNVCHLRVACNRIRRDEDGGWEERPNFFDVSVFGNQADNVGRYLTKGRPVAIDGRLEWREWETPDHGKRQAVSIVADSVQFLGRPAGEGGSREAGGAGAEEAGAAGEVPSGGGTEPSSAAGEIDEALVF